MLRTLSIVILLVGCKGKKEEAKTDPPKPAAADAAVVVSAPDANTTPAAKDDRCAAPCRFLADTPLGEVGEKVKAMCGTEWPQIGEKDCAQLDYQRNCIYATAGYTFKKKMYQDAFGKEPWYKARKDFKDADLSKTATANIADLKKRAGECRQGGVIDDKDRKIVEAWLDKVAAGKPEIPEMVLDYDGSLMKAEDVKKSLVANKAMFVKKLRHGMRYVEADILADAWQKPLEGKKVRKIVEVDLSDEGDDTCEDECGYGHLTTLIIDESGKIIGMSEMWAACPAVYVGDVLQGEILRTFAFAQRERTQTLAVNVPCSGRVTVRIAEEKRETTYLDSLALEIGGESILPASCGALCANDGRYEVIEQGASIEVAFDLPNGIACSGAKLRANGHYVPQR